GNHWATGSSVSPPVRRHGNLPTNGPENFSTRSGGRLTGTKGNTQLFVLPVVRKLECPRFPPGKSPRPVPQSRPPAVLPRCGRTKRLSRAGSTQWLSFFSLQTVVSIW